VAHSEDLGHGFTESERLILRTARRMPKADWSDAAVELLRRYWRMARQRSRAGYARLKDGRTNELYRKWLKQNKLPEVFDSNTWRQFVRACRHGDL
jgi:hypothetical protein